MEIPERLKIGGHWYKVMCPYSFQERGDINGQHDADALVIRLDNKDGYTHNQMLESKLSANFLHEILHACDDMTGHKVFKANEPAIEGIAEMLYQVLHDNKLKFFE